MRQIVTEKLCKSYRGRRVVNEVSVEVKEGEVVGLLGPNGAGKTTTFYMVVGLTRPESGRVWLNGRDITSLPMHLRARAGIGYLAQEPSIFRRLTIEENIMALLEMQGHSASDIKSITDRLLKDLDIERIRNQAGAKLSGGERRRAEIARALCTSPSFFLLDEPFTGVDPIAVEEIQTIVARLRDQGIGILITDHNVRETLAITDHAYIIYDGKILTSGTSEELPKDPIARKFYLGERYAE